MVGEQTDTSEHGVPQEQDTLVLPAAATPCSAIRERVSRLRTSFLTIPFFFTESLLSLT
jgi:hypothetical protein